MPDCSISARDVWHRSRTSGRVAPVENFSGGNNLESLTLAADGDRLLAREGYGWTFLRDRDGSRQLLGQNLGTHPKWHPDSRRFLGTGSSGVRVELLKGHAD